MPGPGPDAAAAPAAAKAPPPTNDPDTPVTVTGGNLNTPPSPALVPMEKEAPDAQPKSRAPVPQSLESDVLDARTGAFEQRAKRLRAEAAAVAKWLADEAVAEKQRKLTADSDTPAVKHTPLPNPVPGADGAASARAQLVGRDVYGHIEDGSSDLYLGEEAGKAAIDAYEAAKTPEEKAAAVKQLDDAVELMRQDDARLKEAAAAAEEQRLKDEAAARIRAAEENARQKEAHAVAQARRFEEMKAQLAAKAQQVLEAELKRREELREKERLAAEAEVKRAEEEGKKRAAEAKRQASLPRVATAEETAAAVAAHRAKVAAEEKVKKDAEALRQADIAAAQKRTADRLAEEKAKADVAQKAYTVSQEEIATLKAKAEADKKRREDERVQRSQQQAALEAAKKRDEAARAARAAVAYNPDSPLEFIDSIPDNARDVMGEQKLVMTVAKLWPALKTMRETGKLPPLTSAAHKTLMKWLAGDGPGGVFPLSNKAKESFILALYPDIFEALNRGDATGLSMDSEGLLANWNSSGKIYPRDHDAVGVELSPELQAAAQRALQASAAVRRAARAAPRPPPAAAAPEPARPPPAAAAPQPRRSTRASAAAPSREASPPRAAAPEPRRRGGDDGSGEHTGNASSHPGYPRGFYAPTTQEEANATNEILRDVVLHYFTVGRGGLKPESMSPREKQRTADIVMQEVASMLNSAKARNAAKGSRERREWMYADIKQKVYERIYGK
jgi:hypothetical protein